MKMQLHVWIQLHVLVMQLQRFLNLIHLSIFTTMLKFTKIDSLLQLLHLLYWRMYTPSIR